MKYLFIVLAITIPFFVGAKVATKVKTERQVIYSTKGGEDLSIFEIEAEGGKKDRCYVYNVNQTGNFQSLPTQTFFDCVR